MPKALSTERRMSARSGELNAHGMLFAGDFDRLQPDGALARNHRDGNARPNADLSDELQKFGYLVFD